MNPEQLISGIKKLSPTPRILPELKRLLKDGDSSMADIVNLIKVDNALSSQLVRVSNTPFYGAATPSANIEEAINRIGFHEVYKLVAFLICNGIMGEKNTIYNLCPDEMWRDSVSCGMMMQMLAKPVKLDQDNAYTIGLMHSIGKTTIYTYYRENRKAPPNFGNSIVSVEKEYKVLGFSHAEAGATLLNKWKFGKETTDPINHQFSPENASEYSKATYALFLSKLLFPHLELDAQQVLDESSFDADMLDKLNLDENDLFDAISDAKTALNGISDILQVA